MAFFKLRFPGQSASAEAVTAGPNENIEVVRRRARHRLIGAVVLVLVAVIGFPLLFDAQPRPVAVDTPIVIPERQAAAPLLGAASVPPEQAPAKPLLPAPEPVTPQASLDAREEVVPSEKEKTAEKVAEKPAEKTPAAKEEAKASPPAKSDKPEKSSPAATAKEEASKAQALLDGKADAATGRFIIQAGAFSDAAKVREVRRKLEQAGFKTYTQVVEKDGKSSTRIRVGPFASREEADKVVARIRKLDLQASVLKL
jgi:DedD protein